MSKLEKTILYTKLFNVYKDLLSNTQKEIISDYYLMDLSFSEIAENRGISRSAAEDAVNKGTKKLEEYENKLKIVEKIQILEQKLNILKEKSLNMKEIEEIEDIEKELEYYGIWIIDR